MSLKDAPYAFSSTYDSALQRSAESWREQAESTAQGTDQATFIAFSDNEPIGIAAIYRLEGQTDVGEILQVWVSPEYRDGRVARDLMDIIFKWASENNFHRIFAGVTNANAKALKFYSKYGFTALNETLPINSDGVSMVKEIK